MRAAVFNAYGPPDVVHVAEVDKPAPGDDELLVKVHATTVNRTDCAYRSARQFVLRFWTGGRRSGPSSGPSSPARSRQSGAA